MTDIKSITASLLELVDNKIKNHYNALPISIPCKVVSRKINTVSCVSLINFDMPNHTLADIPIIKSMYYNYPVKKGDIGILLPLSYGFSNILLGLEDIEPMRSNQMQNFVFLPLIQTTDEVLNTESTIISSQDLKNKIEFSDEKIIINTKDNKVEITLDIEGNIIINTEKEITVNAKENITINTEKEITVNAKENITINTEKEMNINTTEALNILAEKPISIESKDKIDIKCTEVTVTADSKATISSPEVVITGGNAQIKGSVAPNPQGGAFCGIPACLFTGAPHQGDKASGT